MSKRLMKKKKIIGIGSRIMICNGGVNYFCKVYEIQKPSIGGIKLDYIVIDEAQKVPKKIFDHLTAKGGKLNG